METVFKLLGYDDDEAPIRARVFYFHQIGFYAIGVRQSLPERRRNVAIACVRRTSKASRAVCNRAHRPPG